MELGSDSSNDRHRLFADLMLRAANRAFRKQGSRNVTRHIGRLYENITENYISDNESYSSSSLIIITVLATILIIFLLCCCCCTCLGAYSKRKLNALRHPRLGKRFRTCSSKWRKFQLKKTFRKSKKDKAKDQEDPASETDEVEHGSNANSADPEPMDDEGDLEAGAQRVRNAFSKVLSGVVTSKPSESTTGGSQYSLRSKKPDKELRNMAPPAPPLPVSSSTRTDTVRTAGKELSSEGSKLNHAEQLKAKVLKRREQLNLDESGSEWGSDSRS